MDKVLFTPQGIERARDELRQLKGVERPAIIDAVATARAHGDLSENAEYSSAREKQSFIEGRIRDLEGKIARAEVVDAAGLAHDRVRFGLQVTVVDTETDQEKTYQIVGEYEADASSGLIAITAPLARAMIGKSVGDVFEIAAPGGAREYEILRIGG